MNPMLLVLAGVAFYALSKKTATSPAGVGGVGYLAPKKPAQPQQQTSKPSSGGGSGVGSGSAGSGGARTATVDNSGDPFAPFVSSNDSPWQINTQNPDDLSGINAPDSGYIDYLTGETASEGNALGDALGLTQGPNVVFDPGPTPADDNSYEGDLGGYGDGYDDSYSGGGGDGEGDYA